MALSISRDELLKALVPLKPFCKSSDNSLFTYLWFSGRWVYANGPSLGAAIAFETEFSGGIQGEPLLKFLNAAAVDDIDIDVKETAISFKSGRGTVTLPLRSQRDHVWPFPKKIHESQFETVDVAGPVLDILYSCYEARPTTQTRAEHQGIILETNKKRTYAYACRSDTILRMTMPEKLEIPKALIPWQLVASAVKLREDGCTLGISSDLYCVYTDDMRVFSLGFDTSELLSIGDIFKDRLERDVEMVNIPEELSVELKQASTLRTKKDETFVRLHSRGRKLTIAGKYTAGEVEAELELDSKLAEQDIRVNPDRVLGFLDPELVDEFALLPAALVLRGENRTVLISASSMPRENQDEE